MLLLLLILYTLYIYTYINKEDENFVENVKLEVLNKTDTLKSTM